MGHPVWTTIEKRLLQLLSLPHNVTMLRGQGTSPDQAVQEKLAELHAGLSGVPQEEHFTGPKLFLRVVGPSNRTYSGEWWFDADMVGRARQVYFPVKNPLWVKQYRHLAAPGG